MSVAANNLSKEKIQQLLSAIGSGHKEDTSGIETKEYNWNQPRYFDCRQLNRLDAFAKRVASGISLKLGDYFKELFDVKVDSTTEHFAAELVSQVIESEQDDYYLAFGSEQENCYGLISIPANTALIWAMKLLGDSESEVEGSDRDLTHLEESLVWDLLSELIKAFTQDYLDFQPDRNIVKRFFPLELKGSEELCKITFNVKKIHEEEGELEEGDQKKGDQEKSDQEKSGQEKGDQEKSDQVYILIQSSKLIPVVGKSEQINIGFSQEEITKAILANMQQMPVFVTAQLSSVMLSLKEIMSIEVGDLLLLDNKVNDPIELVIGDRTTLLGRPAKLAGKYAIVITELVNN